MAMMKTSMSSAGGMPAVTINRTNNVGNASGSPYRGDLATNFQGVYDPRNGGAFNTQANDSDADVRQAQELTNLLSGKKYNPNSQQSRGMDSTAITAQLDAVRARIGAKNALGQAISSNGEREGSAENDIRYNAGQAMDQGVSNTRKNYNSRGLLYSGMRQGGEASVRSNVAGQMASGLANTKQEYSSLAETQKQAYSAIGLASQQHQLDLANQAFDTVTKNNVARAQAYQQLGQGVGAVAGMAYSASSPSPSQPTNYGAMNPTTNDYDRLDALEGHELRASGNNYGYTG